MKTVVFSPGTIPVLSTYLGYFFLRFPGKLGPEESWELEFLDTYDRRWIREGKIWVRRGETVFLATPPSLFPLKSDMKTAFGLQAAMKKGQSVVKVRSLTFENPAGPPIEGQVIKARKQTYLVLQGREDELWIALLEALLAYGMIRLDESLGAGVFFGEKGLLFEGPDTGPDPVPTDSGVSFLTRRLKDGLRLARQYEQGIRDDIDTECLHQYRVHLRRIRSLLSLGRMWEARGEWVRLKEVFRNLQQATNLLRDLDVLLLDCPTLRESLPWGEGSRLLDWESTIRKKRQAELRSVKAWLASEDYRLAVAEAETLLQALESVGEPWEVSVLAERTFSKAAQGLKRSLVAAKTDSRDSALHEVRIQTKRLRYALDAFGSLVSAPAFKTLSSALKQSQEGLGVFQDRSLLLDRLRSEVETIRGGRSKVDSIAFGVLLGVLATDHSRQKELAKRAADKLFSKPFRRALEKTFRRNETEETSSEVRP